MGIDRSVVRVALPTLVVVALLCLGTAAPTIAAEVRPQNIQIGANGDFDAEHGVVSGKGTKSSPYVFAGRSIQNLRIENTSKYIEIKNMIIANQLVLDWVGDRVKVHYNRIGNLRVNQNVARTGLPTSGKIVNNEFGVVGQLRHWDGTFAYNVVGTPEQLARQTVNFDGFNGARFTMNKIYGFMDARLHGHHHSSGFGEASHMHSAAGHMHDAHMYGKVDHSKRYHRVSITHNTIYANHPYALAYLDTNHAGNDRTAASETEEALNDPHVHYTRMYMNSNRLVGAGVLVNVFNAPDQQKHLRTSRGLAEIKWNKISLAKDAFLDGNGDLHGIEVLNADDVTLKISGNSINGYDNRKGNLLGFLENWDKSAGVFIHAIRKSDIWVMDNRVTNRHFGVQAASFGEKVRWTVNGLKTKNVAEPVAYDGSTTKPK